MQTGTAGAAILAAAILVSPALAEARWLTYANERFGTTADYPDIFSRPNPPPENGDGQGFKTEDGRAELLVYGSFNVENRSPRELMTGNREPGVAYRCAAASARGFVQSGTRGSRITYQRCALSGDILGCVVLSYPQGEKARWDAIVTRVSGSLRFGPHW